VDTRKGAESELAEWKAGVETGAKKRAAGLTPFGSVARDFLDAVKGEIKSSTFESYSQHLRDHLRPVFEAVPVGHVRGLAITKFRSGLLDKGLSVTTVNLVLATLRRVLNWAHESEEGLLAAMPYVPRLKPEKKERKVLTPAQVESYLVEARAREARWFPAILTMARLGLRVGEAGALKHTDLNGTMLHVQRRVYHGEIDTPKGNQDRWVPVPPDLLAVLEGLAGNGSEWMFPNDDGGPMSYDTIRHAMYRLRDRTGMLVTPHGFRHAAASNMAHVIKANPRDVQFLLGHQSLSTTMGYFHGVPEGLAERVQALAEAGAIPQRSPTDIDSDGLARTVPDRKTL
jgi:integrase